MGDPLVRQAIALQRQAKRLVLRSGHTQHLSVLRSAQKLFRRAKARAQWLAKRSLLLQVEQGDMDLCHALFRASRHARLGGGSTGRFPPALDPEAAAAAWGAVFQRAAGAADIAEMPSLVEEITLTVTPEDVLTALGALRQSAPGPDGLEACVLHLGGETLADLLAGVFTCALTDLPAALRIGVTVLLPKTQPPSDDPRAYRPITLLPMLVRLFHKVIDQRLRSLLLPDGAGGDQPLLSRTQAGFVPGRSTHEQALILQQLGYSGASAWAAFLDIEKAFDSFDHAELIDILRSRLPLEWVEVIRRLLTGNSTTICGVVVPLGRGCFQGSPLSPTLCMCFMDDLAGPLEAHIVAHPEDFTLHLRLLAPALAALVLAYLLLFADDVTILADTRAGLQRLANVVGSWAAHRRVRLSPKSGFACLRARPQNAPEDGAALALGTLSVPLLSGSVGYLGVPTWLYQPYGRWSKPHPLDIPALTSLAGALINTFRLPDGQTYVRAQALLRGLHEGILAKALYPTPVVDVDYTALDKLILSTSRRILGLPPTFPSLLLHWELRLLPSELQAHSRALRFANRFARQSWFFACTLGHDARRSPASRRKDLAYWTSRGPLHRLTELLRIYAKALFGYTVRKETGTLWARTAAMEPDTWALRVDYAVGLAYDRWCDMKRENYCAPYREILGITLSRPGRLPKYLRLGGNRACAALRLKSPALRMYFPGQPLPKCAWCLTGDEQGMHLLECPKLPQEVMDVLRPVLVAIAREDGVAPRRGVDQCLNARLISLDWGNQRTETLLRGLEALTFLLRRYRQATPLLPGSRNRPIWPVPSDP